MKLVFGLALTAILTGAALAAAAFAFDVVLVVIDEG